LRHGFAVALSGACSGEASYFVRGRDYAGCELSKLEPGALCGASHTAVIAANALAGNCGIDSGNDIGLGSHIEAPYFGFGEPW